MLMLNKEKEKELVKKYGFEIYDIHNRRMGYKYGTSFIIYSTDCDNKDWACKVDIKGLSRLNGDMLYDLIKDDVILKVQDRESSIEISRLQAKITELEKELAKYRGE